MTKKRTQQQPATPPRFTSTATYQRPCTECKRAIRVGEMVVRYTTPALYGFREPHDLCSDCVAKGV